jgi:putative zinc finger/helix-turn-helix YgiT family protein
MGDSLFGYKCPTCGKGTVSQVVLPAFDTKVEGHPFTVENAVIGICDSCKSKHFSSKEVQRWTQLYRDAHEKDFLSPQAIRDLRRSLGLTMEDFAALIGCTRQSLYNWEQVDRDVHQSRMADLILRLVSQSMSKGTVDVLEFLLTKSAELGHSIKPIRKSQALSGFTCYIRKENARGVKSGGYSTERLATAIESFRWLLYQQGSGQRCGQVGYDTTKGSVWVELEGYPNDRFDVYLKVRGDKNPRFIPNVCLYSGKGTIVTGEEREFVDQLSEVSFSPASRLAEV